jgi:hypothetical protein
VSEREQRIKLLRVAVAGYLGADRALDALVAEMEQYEKALGRIADAGTGVPDWRSMAECARAALRETKRDE